LEHWSRSSLDGPAIVPSIRREPIEFQKFDSFLRETHLFPGNLDRREGTCLESAVDLLIPEGRHSLVGQRITQQPLSCGGVLPTFVGSYLTCRAFTHQHFGTTSPSLGHSAPRGLALKVSRKPRHLLAFGSVSQKFLGQIHWPLSDERCHLNQGAAERFRSSYEGAKQRYLG